MPVSGYSIDYYSAVNKEGNLTFCDWVDGPGGNYAEQNKAVRERQISHSHVESNEQSKLRDKVESDSQMEKRLTAVGGERVWGRRKR